MTGDDFKSLFGDERGVPLPPLQLSPIDERTLAAFILGGRAGKGERLESRSSWVHDQDGEAALLFDDELVATYGHHFFMSHAEIFLNHALAHRQGAALLSVLRQHLALLRTPTGTDEADIVIVNATYYEVRAVLQGINTRLKAARPLP